MTTMPEVTITIVATGPDGSGKTRAIDKMAMALRGEFDIIAQEPKQDRLGGVEVYLFKARLR